MATEPSAANGSLRVLLAGEHDDDHLIEDNEHDDDHLIEDNEHDDDHLIEGLKLQHFPSQRNFSKMNAKSVSCVSLYTVCYFTRCVILHIVFSGLKMCSCKKDDKYEV